MILIHFYSQEGHKKNYKYFVKCFSEAEVKYYINLYSEYRYRKEYVAL